MGENVKTGVRILPLFEKQRSDKSTVTRTGGMPPIFDKPVIDTTVRPPTGGIMPPIIIEPPIDPPIQPPTGGIMPPIIIEPPIEPPVQPPTGGIMPPPIIKPPVIQPNINKQFLAIIMQLLQFLMGNMFGNNNQQQTQLPPWMR